MQKGSAMKMKTEDILKKVKELKTWGEIEDFILSLDLTKEQFEILAENEDNEIKWAIANRSDLPEDLKYKLAEAEDWRVTCAIAERPDLPEDLMYKMAKDERGSVRLARARRTDLPYEDLIIRLSCDYYGGDGIHYRGFKKLENLNTLKSEDLENAYDLIRASKYIGRKHCEKTFDYIISNFPELSEAAKLFKSIILKGKKDLK
jgi:hypothetical protein